MAANHIVKTMNFIWFSFSGTMNYEITLIYAMKHFLY
jgi:hypothetical protein